MAQTMDTYLSVAATQSDLGLSVPQHRLRETRDSAAARAPCPHMRARRPPLSYVNIRVSSPCRRKARA